MSVDAFCFFSFFSGVQRSVRREQMAADIQRFQSAPLCLGGGSVDAFLDRKFHLNGGQECVKGFLPAPTEY